MQTETNGRILIVDDEPLLLRAQARILGGLGYEVQTAEGGPCGLDLFREKPFDVVVSDLCMPGMGGLEFLQAVHEIDSDVPVILMTGQASLRSAERAVEFGAFRYLEKPVDVEALSTAVRQGVSLRRRKTRQHLEAVQVENTEAMAAEVDQAIEKLWLAYQPIVSWDRGTVLGYEALVRSHHEPLRHAGLLLPATEQTGSLQRLSRAVRALAPQPMSQCDALLFVNLFPTDLEDDELFSPSAPLTAFAPQTVLELTERSSLEAIPDLSRRLAALRKLGFRFAIDDLGCGYSGLNSVALVEPEFVKLDMALIRGIDGSRAKREIVSSMLSIGRRLNLKVIAEGVETPAEFEQLLSLGCDCFQGYMFARPGPAFPEVDWSVAREVGESLRKVSQINAA